MKYLILLSGKINSGKNQFAKYLEEELTNKGLVVKQDLYAGDLKNYSVEDFRVLGEVLRNQANRIKATIGPFFNTKYGLPVEMKDHIDSLIDEFTFTKDNFYEDKTDITRVLLQTYGTDIARKRFDDQFWVKTMAKRINNDTKTDVIIVTDVRFPNELEDIHDFIDGWRIIPIRIERNIPRDALIQEHASETALDDYRFWEFIIDNNGTLEEFKDSSKILSERILILD
jgi:hypothetical protein